jgi:hypothetical protein
LDCGDWRLRSGDWSWRGGLGSGRLRADPIQFDPVAEHVAGQNVGLLDARSIARGNGEEMIGQRRQFAAACTGKGYRNQPLGASGLKSGNHVAAVARGGDAT